MRELKATDKITQKMTRDGAISVNMVTGETSRVSDRTPEQDYSPSGDSTAFVHSAAERLDDRRIHKSEKKKRRNRRRIYREGTAANDRPSSRLQFSEEERAAPELQKVIRKSDKAADRLDAARAAVPEKQPSLHQPVNPLARPLQEIGHAAHAKVHEAEQENSGVAAGHLTERGMEKAIRYGNRKVQNWQENRKLKPWREVSYAEQAAVHANADALYQKTLRENPQLAPSNPISRMWQKRKLQKQYAAAYRAAHSSGGAAAAAQTAAKGARKSADTAKKAGEFVSKHKKIFLIVGGIGLLLVMLLGLLQTCSSIFGGGVSDIVAASYLSEGQDLLAAEAAYCAMEDELREYLDTYEQTHDYSISNRAEFEALVKKNLVMQQTDQTKKQQKRIPQITTRLEQIDKVLNKLYEDNALGTIPQDRYEQMSQKYSEEYYALKAELATLQEQLSAYENAGGRAQKFLKLTERHAAFTDLTPTILNEFISRIEVHERDQKRARYAIQHISIYFNYIGKFENEVTQLAEPTEQEIRQMREEIEEAKKEKSRAYHRQYSREYRARNLEKQREYDRMKAREYRARRKAQAAAAQPTQ